MNEKLQNVLLLLLLLATWAWTEHHYREVNATKEEQRKARQVERARHFPPAPPTRPVMVNAITRWCDRDTVRAVYLVPECVKRPY